MGHDRFEEVHLTREGGGGLPKEEGMNRLEREIKRRSGGDRESDFIEQQLHLPNCLGRSEEKRREEKRRD
jgi:hypothetical protein